MRISRFVPGPVVRWFARPYVAGGSMEDGLAYAADAWLARGERATLDLLGEGVEDTFQVLRHVAAYEAMIDAVGSEARFRDPLARPTVSLKPSAFTADHHDAAHAPLDALIRRATERGVGVTVDMEDRTWTERTLAWTTAWHAEGHDVGTVLQTRLHRTEADLARIPAGMRLRLVIGIYPEPAEVALTAKPAMKARMLSYASALLAQGVHVEFATHDERLLRAFLRDVAPAAPERCEVQMLLGVPRKRFLRELAEGIYGISVPFRRYVPFALSWDDATAYLRRRMDESPNIMGQVLRNLLRPTRR